MSIIDRFFGQNTTVKSALKLRFTSLVVPETTAKESRVRLTLCGITYHFYPDLKWASDLGRFVKAPPGVRTQVITYIHMNSQ